MAEVERLVEGLRQAGLNYMFDLLLGGFGETVETLRETVDAVRRLDLPLVGVAVGMRVYPGTPLAGLLEQEEEGSEESLLSPAYHFSPALGKDPWSVVRESLGEDPRFLFLAGPDEESNYNYVGDSGLTQAIAQGERGAYWDIIQRGRL